MKFVRYSASEMFGVPLDNMFEKPGAEQEDFMRLLGYYGIGPQEIEREPVDITPYYWRNPDFRYFLSLAHPEGPAVLEMLPNKDGVENMVRVQVPSYGAVEVEGIRRLEIEAPGAMRVIIGGSPRFQDQLCLHELITCEA